MQRQRALVALVALGTVLTGCQSGGTPSEQATAGLQAPVALTTLAPGDPLEPVQLAVLAAQGDAGTVDMGNLGGPAVINFWATWCSFCVDEMPDFEAVHAELGDRVRFIGVDREDSRDRALTFAQDIGVTYELVEDPRGDFFRSARGRGMPTTLFVDADGIIRHRHAGPLSADQLRSLLAEHLDIGTA